jgi:hypothetical protein
MSQPYRLGTLLVEKHLISQDQLDKALLFQKHNDLPLGQALIQLNMLTERQLKRALKKQSRIRLYAACAAFFIAPFSMMCQAQDSDGIETLPEYTHTQVADNHYADEYSYSNFAVNQNSNGSQINMVEIATAAAWYLSQGGIKNSQFQDVPVKLNLTTSANNTYTLNMSISL